MSQRERFKKADRPYAAYQNGMPTLYMANPNIPDYSVRIPETVTMPDNQAFADEQRNWASLQLVDPQCSFVVVQQGHVTIFNDNSNGIPNELDTAFPIADFLDAQGNPYTQSGSC